VGFLFEFVFLFVLVSLLLQQFVVLSFVYQPEKNQGRIQAKHIGILFQSKFDVRPGKSEHFCITAKLPID
jgi:hypothetical protein